MCENSSWKKAEAKYIYIYIYIYIQILINGISRVFEKVLKYFNITFISTFFVPSSPVEPVIFCLNLNEAQLPGKLKVAPVSFKAGSSL